MEIFDPIRSLYLEEPLASRVRYLAGADRSVFQTIHCGVLFIMAFWSGTSRLSWTRLKQVLSKHDPMGKLEVVVVDTDGCPDLYEFPELGDKLLGGNGETAWIMGGHIIATTWGGSHFDAFETHVKHLLNELAE